ncbi:MAG: 3-dehydroquinate synthase [Endozoicomonadaceae bacterium]|nr:3-dehydroquinate synthase [Endozoicomonadaceae bacterium]
MHTLMVDFAHRSYSIYIGYNTLSKLTLSDNNQRHTQFVLITNQTIANLHQATLLSYLSNHKIQTIIIQEGENWKNLDTVSNIIDQLMTMQCDRHTTLIALGGGVIGDITGFVASCYRRGIRFIQIPTTLLAQVDASIGGKTGVNHPKGKNMIGTFYQPYQVIIDLKWLDTLPDPEYISGLAEIIKYGLIGDVHFYHWLSTNISALMNRDQTVLMEAVYKSCQYKANITASDEYDTGAREMLNFGHTIGHALETITKYQDMLHGEAVSIGMVFAMKLSLKIYDMPQQNLTDLIHLLRQAKLPTDVPKNIDLSVLLSILFQDKKVLDKQLRFVLLKKIGQAVVIPISSDMVHALLSEKAI